jgi:hypothetical protein
LVIKAYDATPNEYDSEAEVTIRTALQTLVDVAGSGSRTTVTAANRLRSLLTTKALKVLKEQDYEAYRDCLKERYNLMSSFEAKDNWNLVQAKRDWTEAEEIAAAEEPRQKQFAEWMDKFAEAAEFERQGQALRSLNLTRQLLETSNELFGAEHANTVQAMCAVAKSASNSGDLATAVSLSENVLAYWRKHGEVNDPDLVGALINMGAG